MSTPLIIGAVFVAIAIIFIVIALGSRKPGDSLQSRLAEYSMRETPATLEEIELSHAVPRARAGADGPARVRLCRAVSRRPKRWNRRGTNWIWPAIPTTGLRPSFLAFA